MIHRKRDREGGLKGQRVGASIGLRSSLVVASLRHRHELSDRVTQLRSRDNRLHPLTGNGS